jgi:hypothetical protein
LPSRVGLHCFGQMPLRDLNFQELEIVKDCLLAAVEGPFFPDWEFHTLFGLERVKLKSILQSWPDLDESDEAVVLAINNSFNNLLGYPHGMLDNWSDYIRVDSRELARIYAKWKGRSLSNYFDGFM